MANKDGAVHRAHPYFGTTRRVVPAEQQLRASLRKAGFTMCYAKQGVMHTLRVARLRRYSLWWNAPLTIETARSFCWKLGVIFLETTH